MIDDDYQPPTPAVESMAGDKLRIFCADQVPPRGAAVAVDTDDGQRLWAVVERHLGARRIEAWLPGRPPTIAKGTAVQITDDPATFRPPKDGVITPTADLITAGDDQGIALRPEAPPWSELSGRLQPLPLGIKPVDALTPLARGGLNLILDHSPTTAAIDGLYSRIPKAHTFAESLYVGPHDGADAADGEDGTNSDEPRRFTWRIDSTAQNTTHIAALQIAIALAARLRQAPDALALIELPTLTPPPHSTVGTDAVDVPQGIPEIIDRLGRHFVSTKDASLTTVLHLSLAARRQGLAAIIETLRLGDVDATIYIDDQGRFDPRRSSSSVAPPPSLAPFRQKSQQILQQADQARDKQAIFGDGEINADQRQALAEEPQLFAPFADIG